MNKLVILILLSIAFSSCDGRHRAYRSNEEVLKEANLFRSFSEVIKFIPQRNTKIITDTLLNNGFKVKLNYHSIESDFVIMTSKKGNDSIIKKHFKNFEAQFSTSFNNTIIANGIINKELFYNYTNRSFLDHAIMQYVWIDYLASTQSSIQLNTSFKIPETDKFKDFTLTIFNDGNIKIKEVKTKFNTI